MAGALARFTARAGRLPGVKPVLLWPPIARPGYWLVTACAFLWGAVLLHRLHRGPGIWYYRGLPRWAFARGGTTLGAIYLTRDTLSEPVLEHEAVHRTQWRHYGLPYILLYLAAGADALHNRFEIEAGLVAGGYLRAP